MIGNDPYYGRPEVSNSDLSELKKYFSPPSYAMDLEDAYRFGNLVDAMITEPERVDHLKKQVDGVQFKDDEWNLSYDMLKAFRNDPICAQYLKMASGQSVFTNPDFKITFDGFEFSLPVRCKYDLWFEIIKSGSDIKSTAATTQKQFEDACKYFDYDRQRAWYMDITGAKQDMLIGISKKNKKIFKLPITRDSNFYKEGKEKYQELAFKYWMLFDGFKLN